MNCAILNKNWSDKGIFTYNITGNYSSIKLEYIWGLWSVLVLAMASFMQ